MLVEASFWKEEMIVVFQEILEADDLDQGIRHQYLRLHLCSRRTPGQYEDDCRSDAERSRMRV